MVYPYPVEYAEQDLLYEDAQIPFGNDGCPPFNSESIEEEVYEDGQAEELYESAEPIETYFPYEESSEHYPDLYLEAGPQTYYEIQLHPFTFAPVAVLAVSFVLVLVALGLINPVSGLLNQGSSVNTSNPVQPPEPIPVGAGIAPLFTPAIQYWAPQIQEWAEKWGLDPNLVATVMQIESCGDPNAVSSAGAMGLFQVMPFHFEAGEDGYDPQTNAKRGLNYLRQALEARNGEPRLAFAGYNGGINGAKRAESYWPNETQRYVYWGTGIYEDAAAGKQQSERLNEWLASGGSGLCERARARLGINQ